MGSAVFCYPFFPLNKIAFFPKVFRLRFQTSYVGGKERARNLLSDAPENDSVAARGAELWPFEGSRVPQHDLIFWKSFKFSQKEFRFRFQTSYVGGKARARNFTSIGATNSSGVALRAELWPFKGSQVSQNDM